MNAKESSDENAQESQNNRVCMLLEEYKLCQQSTEKLESVIWQTSAVIGIGSITALVTTANGQECRLISATIGGVVIATTFIWWFMAKRWWSIQHAKYLRMRHIEEELGLYQMRYVRYLDDPKTLSKSKLSRERQRELRQFSNYQRAGVQYYLRFLPYLVSAGWLLLVIVQSR